MQNQLIKHQAVELGRTEGEKQGKALRKQRRRNAAMRYLGDFLAGIARGFGVAIGFTLLGGIALMFLQRIAFSNVPLIGTFVAELLRIIRLQL